MVLVPVAFGWPAQADQYVTKREVAFKVALEDDGEVTIGRNGPLVLTLQCETGVLPEGWSEDGPETQLGIATHLRFVARNLYELSEWHAWTEDPEDRDDARVLYTAELSAHTVEGGPIGLFAMAPDGYEIDTIVLDITVVGAGVWGVACYSEGTVHLVDGPVHRVR